MHSFLKTIHIINYSRDALHKVAGHVLALAHTKNLPAHGATMSAQFPKKQ